MLTVCPSGDAADIFKICDQFPDPVEKWPAVAAKGELGAHRMMLTEALGYNSAAISFDSGDFVL